MNEACRVITQAYRVLKPGGIVRIVVPDAILRKNEDPEKFPLHEHKTAWTYHSLRWLLEGAGLKTTLVKFWDENGIEHFDELALNKIETPIRRLNSLIIDGIKLEKDDVQSEEVDRSNSKISTI
jgi:predicted SAM-dependent methyltransferase